MGKRKRDIKDTPVNEIFAKQLGEEVSFICLLTFVVSHESRGEEVVSWRKSKINEITEKYEYIGTDKGLLPRFILKA